MSEEDDAIVRAALEAVQAFNIANKPDAEYEALCIAKEALEDALDAIGAALARRSHPN